jgi:two-component system chemotaxis response regulator CheB
MLTAPGALTGAEDKDARGKIRILVVDDSVVMRQLITRMLAADAAFEVVGFARDGLDALDRVEQLLPDLVTLDIEMPQLDGLGTLRILQQRHPRIRVVMCSSLTERGASVTIDALLAGTSDYVTKQQRGEMSTDAYEVLQRELTTKIRQIFALDKASPAAPRMAAIAPPLTSSHPPLALPVTLGSKRPFAPELLAIGVSTGGPPRWRRCCPCYQPTSLYPS